MSQTFKQAFYFFRKNILQLLAYTFAIAVVVIVLAQLLVPLFFGGMTAEQISIETIKPFAQLLNLLVKPVYTGGLIALIYSLATEQGRGIVNCLFAGIMRWPYMLIANVITSMAIFAGLMLFVLPGIWLFSRLFLVPYLVMLNNQTPVTAILNSYNYTKDYSLSILTDMGFLLMLFISVFFILGMLQLLHPFLILLFLLLFQTLAHVVYYRHYEILMDTIKDKSKTIEKS